MGIVLVTLYAGFSSGFSVVRLNREDLRATQILEEKMESLLSVNPELVVTANPGCQMQLQSGMRSRGRSIPVRHLAELLAEAY